MEVLHQIRVDLTEDSVNPSNIAIKQWDKNSHRFWISLWEGSAAFAIPSAASVMLRGKKADGTQFDAPCTVDGNAVTVLLPEQALTCPGSVGCELALVESDSLLKSLTFYFAVMPVVYDPEGPVSSDAYAALEQMVQKGVAASAAANAAAALANEAAQAALEAAQSCSVVTDPTTGQQASLQTALNNLYNCILATPSITLTATEYDALGLTAAAYDAKNITAQDYDVKSGTVLIGS
ncbi:MAG TPA: BppU family phage baseplate upper protein [Candidatus Gallacutalibacter stercoravium]|nr:BppU family phage baseplate upper protein [Candidatus Gallacutalibacter stercoravium]